MAAVAGAVGERWARRRRRDGGSSTGRVVFDLGRLGGRWWSAWLGGCGGWVDDMGIVVVVVAAAAVVVVAGGGAVAAGGKSVQLMG